MATLVQDLRYGLRTLAKSPGFTAVAVLTLALGIGANTAIFSLADAVLWKPLPVAHLDRLMMVMERRQEQQDGWIPVSPANYLDWKSQNDVFERLSAYEFSSTSLTNSQGYSGEPERLQSVLVSPDFFETLELKPLFGRTFAKDEELLGKDRVAVLSHKLWELRFGADPNLIGKTVRLDGRDCTVIGIMRDDFSFPAGTDLWMPLAIPDALRQSRFAHNLFVLGRLKAGLTSERSQTEMAGIAQRIARQNPASNTGWTATVFSLHSFLLGEVRGYVWMLLCVVGFVLLIACANVANLQLARATSRSKEIAVKAALGASGWRVVRQLLAESVVLSTLGAAAGVLLAVWGVEVLKSLTSADIALGIPGWNQIQVDTRALGFTLAIAVASGVLSGLAPAFLSWHPRLNEALKGAGRSSSEGSRAGALRGFLVAAEVALAVILLAGAGLMVKGVMHLAGHGDQLGAGKLLTMRVALPISKYPKEFRAANFFQQVLERVTNLPGVESAAVATAVPHSGIGSVEFASFTPQAKAMPPEKKPTCLVQSVSPTYFKTVHLPLRQGRAIGPQDGRDAPLVAVISETMAKEFWPDQNPIGKRLKLGQGQSQNPWIEIVGVVGVVGDAQQLAAFGLEARPTLYVPYLQRPVAAMQFAIRTAGDPKELIGAAVAQVHGVDPELPVSHIMTMEGLIDDELSGLRAIGVLMTIFGALALLLAAVGVYGVMSYSVNQRTQEIGIRMALGAGQREVAWVVVKRGIVVTLGGVAVGVAAALGLGRLMSSLLFGIRPTDPMTFVAVAVVLTIVALVASYIPARRATKVDPMVALRYE